MSDDLDIRSGGLVAVDPGELRQAAVRYAALAADLQTAARQLGEQARRLGDLGVAYGGLVPARIQRTAQRMWSSADDADGLCRRLRLLAEVYEIVELRAERALATGGRRAELDGLLASARSAHPDAARAADRELESWSGNAARGILSADNGLAWWMPLFPAAAALMGAQQVVLRMLGRGRIGAGRHLDGTAPPVELLPVGAARPSVPPPDLGTALERIPSGDARVRVETYTMPDGSRRYAVYLAGTRDFSLRTDHPEAWDMDSNLRLDAHRNAASYEAARQALAAAGVPEGARLYLFGHSQGGLIADWLAIDGGYDTRLLVTAGSPTEAEVGLGTLSVQLRHTDDIVPAFAAGGSPGTVGAPGSLVVERTGDPGAGAQDLRAAAHHLTVYVATARMLDAAPDPRTARMREVLGELRSARSVTAMEYDARRGSEVTR